jgi:hypothetical protein
VLHLEVEEVSFGGNFSLLENEIAPFSTWMLAFGDLGYHFLSLDVTLEG